MGAAVPLRTLSELKQLLADRYPDARPLVERDASRLSRPVATGIAALDAALPGGGIPRGKLSVWAPEGGAAAMLRAMARAVLLRGERSAWVDASGTLSMGWALDAGGRADAAGGRRGVAGAAGAALAGATAGAGAEVAGKMATAGAGVPVRSARPATSSLPTSARTPALTSTSTRIPLLVHPPNRLQALRATELLLRSGAFALVVLDGANPRSTETIRLTRAVRDGGGAFVALTPGTSMAAVRLSSQLLPQRVEWEPGLFGEPGAAVLIRATVQVRALGWQARAEVALPVAGYDVRSALDPGFDRRGVR